MSRKSNERRPAPDALRGAVAALVTEHGLDIAARALGIAATDAADIAEGRPAPRTARAVAALYTGTMAELSADEVKHARLVAARASKPRAR